MIIKIKTLHILACKVVGLKDFYLRKVSITVEWSKQKRNTHINKLLLLLKIHIKVTNDLKLPLFKLEQSTGVVEDCI